MHACNKRCDVLINKTKQSNNQMMKITPCIYISIYIPVVSSIADSGTIRATQLIIICLRFEISTLTFCYYNMYTARLCN